MPRLVIELTNRCNLSCGHCFDERHAASGDLSLEVIEKVLREGKGCGIEQLSFTGGEPTIHRRFKEIIQRVAKAGYRFSFVSNGVSFPRIYPLLLKHRRWFVGVTFSLDGAREETHDQLARQRIVSAGDASRQYLCCQRVAIYSEHGADRTEPR